VTQEIDGTINPQRRDRGWFNEKEEPACPLTSQEQDNIDVALANIGSNDSPISVSDAHSAMEYYLFADSAKAISELSNASLAHLYFVKVQPKPTGYDQMDEDKKRTWVNSRIKAIRRLTKRELIEALVEAVRVRLSGLGHYG
jgi:hypothetical protein